MRKETIKKIINLIITVLTAIASAVCVQRDCNESIISNLFSVISFL